MALGDSRPKEPDVTVAVARSTGLLMQQPDLERAVRYLQASFFAVPVEPHTLDQALDRYELEHLVLDLKPATVEWRTRAVRVLRRWGARDLAGRWRDVGAQVYADARKRGHGEAGASMVVNTLARVLNLAKSWGWLHAEHDLKGICRVRSRRRIVHVGEAQVVAIARELDALPPTFEIAADCVRLIWLTSMRVSESCGLHWDEVDLDERVIHLRDSKTGPRSVELCTAAVELLRRRKRARKGDHPFVFAARRGPNRPLHRRQVLHALARACASAHVPRLVVHALRHHFATLGAQLYLPGPAMSKALGHSNEWQTTQYQHLNRDDVRAAVEIVGSAIAKKLGGAR